MNNEYRIMNDEVEYTVKKTNNTKGKITNGNQPKLPTINCKQIQVDTDLIIFDFEK